MTLPEQKKACKMWHPGRSKSGGGYFRCPHCGAKVEAGASACPECGSDGRTGWAEGAHEWGDFPTGYGEDDEFDYEEFIRREFSEKEGRIFGIPVGLFVVVLAALVLGALIVVVLVAR